MKTNIFIFLFLGAIATATIVDKLYTYAKAQGYTIQQVESATWKNAANLLDVDENDRAKWGFGKVKHQVAQRLKEDAIQAKKVQLRDAIKAVFPNASFERVRNDAWIVDLDGDPNDV